MRDMRRYDTYIVGAMHMQHADDRGPAERHERAVVLAADAEAAIAAAEQRHADEDGLMKAQAFDDGERHMLEAVVLAADAEAAIAAAFQDGMDQMIGGIEQVSYDKGQRDMLARLTSEEAHAVIVKVLNDEGAMSEGGWHGWRCFDKGRYPEPCRCTEYVVDEVLSALRALQEKP